jgi:small Trp-rich protein
MPGSTWRDFSESGTPGNDQLQFLVCFAGPLLEGVMYLLIAGIALMLMKYFEFGFATDLSWWWVLSPFALAIVWWIWADTSGYTRRKAMEKMDQKKRDRIDKQREALGIKTKGRSR